MVDTFGCSQVWLSTSMPGVGEAPYRGGLLVIDF